MKEILSANKGKSGVYRINNTISGEVYIGSAVDLSRRLRDYFSTRPRARVYTCARGLASPK